MYDLSNIKKVLESDNPDQRRIAVTGLEWLATLLAKNSDYGSSVWKPPALKPEMDAGDAILVRMSDKVARIASLQSKEAEVDESLEDTIKDLGAYAILWLARPKEATYQGETYEEEAFRGSEQSFGMIEPENEFESDVKTLVNLCKQYMASMPILKTGRLVELIELVETYFDHTDDPRANGWVGDDGLP